jgi:HAD superfamily hydrolase (TIGR01549 family)
VKKRRLYFGEISDTMWSEILRRKEAHYFRLVEGADILSPEVRDIVPELAGRYRLAIVSNTTRPCFERIFPPELARFFQVTLFADEVEEPKPSPEPLRRVMRRMGVESDECCYVGDSVLDVQMAKSAGVPVVGVSTGDNAPDELRAAGADAVIGSLSDLPHLLKVLFTSKPDKELP